MPKELELLLHSLGFLKQYLTESEGKTLIDKTTNTIFKHNWPFIRNLQALKHKKIFLPSEEEIRDNIWMMYVDGVNSMTCEHRHPEFSRDTKQYYHKSNGCGITYEFGTNFFQYRLICRNGPFKAGDNNYK